MIASNKFNIRHLLGFALMAFVLMFVMSSRAFATLPGENGPIVYVEENEVLVECAEHEEQTIISEENIEEECYSDVTQVVTTDNEGQNPVVAVEFSEEDDEYATTATISPNDEDGNHNIVLGTVKYECADIYPDMDLSDVSRVNIEEDYCYFHSANAVIYRVQIDAEGNPLGEPELVATVSGQDENAIYFDNYYIELSYSPDGKTVVGTRFYYSEPIKRPCDEVCLVDHIEENDYGPKFVIETIDLESGDINTVVGPKFDPYMNAGYGSNGNIYFSQSPARELWWEDTVNILDVEEDDENYSSDIWYLAPGMTEAIQLTNTFDINEYFLSVSPDSKLVLVCDPNEMQFYLVNTATGEVTIIELDDSDNPFMPIFFSPDGTGYLGQKDFKAFYRICGSRVMAARALAVALDEEDDDIGVAYAALNDFRNAVVLNDMQNPDDWAPIVEYPETPTTPGVTVVLGETSPPTLAKTGINALTSILLGAFVATSSLALVTTRKQ